MRSLRYLSKGWPIPMEILEMMPRAKSLTERFVSAMAFFNTPPISPIVIWIRSAYLLTFLQRCYLPMLGFSLEFDLISKMLLRASNPSFRTFQASLLDPAMTFVEATSLSRSTLGIKSSKGSLLPEPLPPFPGAAATSLRSTWSLTGSGGT